MTEIRFYHLTRTSLDAALPQLLQKSLERGWRAVVMASSQARVQALDEHLWTFGDRSFLPHGTARDGYAEHQPVWLTTEAENPNDAQVLFLVDGAETPTPEAFEIVAEVFDGTDGEAVQAARRRWKAYKDAGYEMTYWKQDDRGRWQKGA